MWHYSRGIAYAAQGDFTAAKTEANAIAALEGGDFTLLNPRAFRHRTCWRWRAL